MTVTNEQPSKYNRVSNVTHRLIDEKLVNHKLHDVLFNMTEASYNVLWRSRSKRVDVRCAWENGESNFQYEPALYQMVKDCIEYRNGEFLWLWKKYYSDYVKSGYTHELNVTWDRINDDKSKGNHNYTLENMQPLPFVLNVYRANMKPNFFYLQERGNPIPIIKGEFMTLNDVKEAAEEYAFSRGIDGKNLINRAVQFAKKNESGQAFEFEYNKRKYLAQIFYFDKVAMYYS